MSHLSREASIPMHLSPFFFYPYLDLLFPTGTPLLFLRSRCFCSVFLCNSASENLEGMADWGPVIIAVVLFVLLTPGLLFQVPAKGRVVEFGNMHTSVASILVHAILFLGLITIFLIAIGVHVYAS
ncbi:uncharacterized protein LOC133875456 [Alnus glutinosa]|uniref:uncharacterized protein LOC133875456 n=1 Tax=Alnus glutinosa TaxID=3517 RepID=UPI002D79AF44|nr:uncharacterized protein LOC133875456 [Alnus glutinosa]